MARTRDQIRVELNQVHRKINTTQEEKRKYETSLNNANKLVSNLNASFNNIKQSQDYMKKWFTINNKTADNGEIEKVKAEMKQIISKINNTIIPSIRTKINTLNTQYRNLNNQKANLEREYRQAEM